MAGKEKRNSMSRFHPSKRNRYSRQSAVVSIFPHRFLFSFSRPERNQATSCWLLKWWINNRWFHPVRAVSPPFFSRPPPFIFNNQQTEFQQHQHHFYPLISHFESLNNEQTLFGLQFCLLPWSHRMCIWVISWQTSLWCFLSSRFSLRTVTQEVSGFIEDCRSNWT